MALGMGCEDGEIVTHDATGNEELGVGTFTARELGSDLVIEGRDGRGEVLVDLRLRQGVVQVPDWTQPTYGRALDIDIAGHSIAMTYAGTAPLALPRSEIAPVDALLMDPFVAPVLQRWGITLTDPDIRPNSEVPFEACTETQEGEYTGCAGAAGGVRGACYYPAGSEQEEKIVCNNGVRALRRCSYPGGPTACGEAGPQGCAVCWNETNFSGTARCSDNVCIWSGGGGGGSCKDDFEGCSSHEECCSEFCNPESNVCSGEA
jgi:hypothetical protein